MRNSSPVPLAAAEAVDDKCGNPSPGPVLAAAEAVDDKGCNPSARPVVSLTEVVTPAQFLELAKVLSQRGEGNMFDMYGLDRDESSDDEDQDSHEASQKPQDEDSHEASQKPQDQDSHEASQKPQDEDDPMRGLVSMRGFLMLPQMLYSTQEEAKCPVAEPKSSDDEDPSPGPVLAAADAVDDEDEPVSSAHANVPTPAAASEEVSDAPDTEIPSDKNINPAAASEGVSDAPDTKNPSDKNINPAEEKVIECEDELSGVEYSIDESSVESSDDPGPVDESDWPERQPGWIFATQPINPITGLPGPLVPVPRALMDASIAGEVVINSWGEPVAVPQTPTGEHVKLSWSVQKEVQKTRGVVIVINDRGEPVVMPKTPTAEPMLPEPTKKKQKTFYVAKRGLPQRTEEAKCPVSEPMMPKTPTAEPMVPEPTQEEQKTADVAKRGLPQRTREEAKCPVEVPKSSDDNEDPSPGPVLSERAREEANCPLPIEFFLMHQCKSNDPFLDQHWLCRKCGRLVCACLFFFFF